ncbi:hypothetical protein BDK51DRAFT_40476, partial [Blyttiomyces helicus]
MSSGLLLDEAFGYAPAQPSSSATTSGKPANVADFPLTPEESNAYSHYYKMVDADGKNTVAPAVAAPFLKQSRLPDAVLSLIWGQCDTENKGFLTQPTFYRALKLVSLAQAGKQPVVASLSTTTALPIFEGIDPPPLQMPAPQPQAQPIAVQRTGTVSTHSTGPGAGSFSVSQEEKDRFAKAFASCSPVNGLVTGESARELFLKSTLPLETLSKIWTLVDRSGTGKLAANQFNVAMFLITHIRSGKLSTVPSSIPPQLWNAVAVSSTPPDSPVVSFSSSTPGPASSSSFIPPASSGSFSAAPLSPAIPKPPSVSIASPTIDRRRTTRLSSVPVFGSAAESPAVPVEWAIKEEEKANYDAFFDSIDTAKKGYLTGADCYSFLLQSKLPETILAKIWDLSDVSKTGDLSKDEFAIAMYLIRNMSSGPLPATLPENLIPPSMRQPAPPTPSSLGAAGSAPGPSPLARSVTVAAPAPPPSIETDLLGGLDGLDPLGAPKPLGESSKTKSLSSLGTIPRLPPSREAADLAERESDLASRKSDLRQIESQLTMLQPAVEDLAARRSAVDAEYRSITEEKHRLTLQLSQARATYEADTAIVADTEQILYRERQNLEVSRAEWRSAEQTLGALRAEKISLEEAVATSRAELGDLHRQISELTEAAKPLRIEVEARRA